MKSPTPPAYTFYYILCLLHDKAIRDINNRDGIVLKAIRLAALHTRKVHMIDVLTVMTTADTILLMPRAVVYLMQQMMLYKQTQGTEDARTIHMRHPRLYIVQRECLRLTTNLLPYQQADCRRFDAMLR